MKLLFAIIASLVMLSAQALPDRPVTIVTNMPVGSGPDLVLRRTADALSERWQRPVVIDNRPGAGGLIALQHYLTLPADGRTFYYGDSGNFTAMPLMYKKQDLLAEITLLAPAYDNYSWAIVTSSQNATVQDFVKSVQSNTKFGSWGVGTSGHLCGLEIAKSYNLTAVHVPYKNYPEWYVDIANGELSYSCSSVGSAKSMIDTGRLRVLAVTGTARNPLYPTTPTIQETLGIKNFKNRSGWLAFFINKNTDTEQTKFLEKELRQALQSRSVTDAIAGVYSRPVTSSNAEFSRVIDADYKNYVGMIREFAISFD